MNYELFYQENGWASLGAKKENSNELKNKNVPTFIKKFNYKKGYIVYGTSRVPKDEQVKKLP